MALRLALVLPCFNEEDVVPFATTEIVSRMRRWIADGLIDHDSYAMFVDDGSQDQTWAKIVAASTMSREIKAIKLSRNFGHQAALLAGLSRVARHCDCAISLDVDLQQDVDVIPEFLARHREGAHLVFGVRKSRNTDGSLKRWTGEGFYWLMQRCGVLVLRNHADYRLMSQQALLALEDYQESNLFLRGIIHELGFRTSIVHFDVRERRHGSSKYGVGKMLRLAFGAIASFSVLPLRVVSALGVILMLASFGMSSYVLFQRVVVDRAVPGWASTVLPIYFLGGVQLLCLGVIGEYIGRIYAETKRRPRFLVETEIGSSHDLDEACVSSVGVQSSAIDLRGAHRYDVGGFPRARQTDPGEYDR